ncbi:hypothetical protein [Bacillus phage vB_BanS-Thrax1]|nr:hypothetical protein [Bacillus phage vB_BanS-Thrax1]
MRYSIRYKKFLIEEILNVYVIELSYGLGGCEKVYWVHCKPIIDVIYYDGKTTGKGMKHHSDVVEQVIGLMKEDVSIPQSHVDEVCKQRLKPSRRVGKMYLNA